LLFAFNAFRDDLQLHPPRERDNRINDGVAVFVVRHMLDKMAVNFKAIDRVILQIRQRGIAGAKVVHRDTNTQFTQTIQRGYRLFLVFHQHALGDFQLKTPRFDAGFCQNLAQKRQQITTRDLTGRKVDCHPGRIVTAGSPTGELITCLAQDPFANRDDQTRSFGERDKAGWRHHAKFRVNPAHQGFQSSQVFALQGVLWLIVQDKFATLNGRTQAGFEPRGFAMPLIQLIRKELMGVFADFFGAIHGHISRTH